MARIGNLEIWTNEGVEECEDDVQLPPTSLRYRTVESLIDLGLRILECPQGIESLVQVVNALLDEFEGSQPPVPHTFKGARTRLSQYVTQFLQKVRKDFPYVYLDRADGQATTDRLDWGSDVSTYIPKAAGYFIVHRTIVNNMIWISQQSDEVAGNHYVRYQFEMGLTMAHEIVHLLTGYITGTMFPVTPRAVVFDPYGKGKEGEAGRYWEVKLLGGTTEQYIERKDPMDKRRQAGEPFLVGPGFGNAEAKLIPDDCIKDFLAGNFTFPIPTSTEVPPTTRSKLRASREETTMLLESQRRMPITTSPRIEKNPTKIQKPVGKKKELGSMCKRLTKIQKRLSETGSQLSDIQKQILQNEKEILEIVNMLSKTNKQ